jgi:hypothetical protein
MRTRLIASAVVVAAAGSFLACNDSTSPESTTYIATLTGANEKPTAVTTPATGTATYVLTGNTLTYTVTVNGLLTNATMSHIHVGSAAQAGVIVVPYTVSSLQSGLVTSGTIDLTYPVASGANTISGDSLKVLLNNGNAYTNVHTSGNPGGEIRGQIIRQ